MPPPDFTAQELVAVVVDQFVAAKAARPAVITSLRTEQLCIYYSGLYNGLYILARDNEYYMRVNSGVGPSRLVLPPAKIGNVCHT